jgi:curved DNA-binding protein CbpA
MTDYFALFGEARRPWLDPEKLKKKYYRLSLAALPDAELNEAFRVLSDPKLRLHHLLTLEGVDLVAGRTVPLSVAELFWKTGALLRETERWLLRNAEATSTLARALLKPEWAKIEERLGKLEEQTRATYESQLAQIREADANWNPGSPNELTKLLELCDSISYLTRLLEQTAEKRFQLSVA